MGSRGSDTTPMHFTVLRLPSTVASLAVLSRAYSNDVFEARNDYIDELSTRTDASLSSLSTREIIAELSERLYRRKLDTETKYECTKCLATSKTGVSGTVAECLGDTIPEYPEVTSDHCGIKNDSVYDMMPLVDQSQLSSSSKVDKIALLTSVIQVQNRRVVYFLDGTRHPEEP
ncbi:hypothetical protein DFP72DRAFT_849995 [Ephemerocybe angulata]|uniref:Uncharacterized protein n=1 Tax=Ephemerocybe angulata TaxID=980116 RepID=A0A8H6HTI2_9AGAR|nr:hypothetical protein DFP72DRAFT_849995 [Tulosesus angulatus]